MELLAILLLIIAAPLTVAYAGYTVWKEGFSEKLFWISLVAIQDISLIIAHYTPVQ